jgi:ubiquinone/menaquinone biosynthesis C-methylase UbiE
MPQKGFEYFLENNPLRAIVRERVEVKPLRTATDIGRIPHALHIACGDGTSSLMILKYFSPERLSGMDKEDALIAAANRANASGTVDFSAQDVRSMSFADETFDAAFNLADLHNYVDWKTGVMELKRVLKHGGLLIMEDLSLETFSNAVGKVFRRLTEHPYDDMFTVNAFREFILGCGFEILHFEEKNPLGLLKYFVMVARKP